MTKLFVQLNGNTIFDFDPNEMKENMQDSIFQLTCWALFFEVNKKRIEWKKVFRQLIVFEKTTQRYKSEKFIPYIRHLCLNVVDHQGKSRLYSYIDKDVMSPLE